MSKVALIRCESYEYGDVKRAVRQGINFVGGVRRFAAQDESIASSAVTPSSEAP